MKKTRKEREQEILARMEEGLRENEEKKKNEGAEEQTEEVTQEVAQEEIPQLHCRKCKALMEDGKCPACGYTMYTPIDPRTQRRVCLILTAVCLVALVVIWVLTK